MLTLQARSVACSQQTARPEQCARICSQRAPGRRWHSCWRRSARSARLQLSAAASGEGAEAAATAVAATPIPTQLNTIPHTREIRRYFYSEATEAVRKALEAGLKRLSIRVTIPELNTEFDVYRVGTLLELVRDLAIMLSADSRKVKVCVQQPLGQGVFQGTPLSLNGVPRIMKQMDWGPATPFLSTGQIGAEEVEGADAFVVVAPQNIVGHTIVPFLTEMVEAAEAAGKPMVLVNPKLGDIPSSGGVMGIMGRQDRMDFVSTFQQVYHFRLLYLGAAMYPIMGALRYSFAEPWKVYQRAQLGPGKEEYRLIGSFEEEPKAPQITQCFRDADN